MTEGQNDKENIARAKETAFHGAFPSGSYNPQARATWMQAYAMLVLTEKLERLLDFVAKNQQEMEEL